LTEALRSIIPTQEKIGKKALQIKKAYLIMQNYFEEWFQFHEMIYDVRKYMATNGEGNGRLK